MSTSKLAGRAKYVAIPLLTWALSALVAEFLFRINGDRTTEDKRGIYSQPDNGNFKHLPGMDTESQWGSGRFQIHTDALGLRCDAQRSFGVVANATIDVLFIGDSQGFGNGVDFEDTIPGGVAIQAAAHGYRIANASVGGHALRNQLELARWLREKQGLRAKHYIILMTPMMLTACDSFTKATVGPDGRLYDRPMTAIERGLIWLKTHAVIYTKLRDAARNIGLGADPSGAVPFVFQVYDATGDRDRALDRSLECLTGYLDFAKQDGSTLAVVYLPLTVELDFADVNQAGESKGLKLDPNRPEELAKSIARRLGIPFLSLRRSLVDARAQGSRLHLKGDFHYDAPTSRKCAKELWPEIEPLLR